MMSEKERNQERFSFKTVQLLKDQSLGIGSYGAVCKAKCDDLICAAKILHPTLFDPSALRQVAPQIEHRLPIRRFEQECEFMSGIRHPNIVQYLGMYRDSGDTHLPVLLMELMDESLTHFVESTSLLIPYHITVNICHDVTLALSFLHSNSIVHRDLSSNNILLRGNILAKVTDFGMARLGDITRFTSTVCPCTDVYMPPEAVQDKPVYTEKIDCFSFGVITLQILTHRFPNPGDRLQEVELSYPGLGAGRLLMQIPEVNRRHNHISKVDPDHPLLSVILDCLKDKDNERPSAHQLCEKIADLKEMDTYIDSTRTVQDKDEVIQELTSRVEEKDRTILSKDKEIQQLRLQLQKYSVQEKGEREQLPKQEQVMTQSELSVKRRVHQQSDEQSSETGSEGKELDSVIKLKWIEGRTAPFKMYRSCDAVVNGNTLYLRAGGTVEIYSYDVSTDSWSRLPDCAKQYCSITVIIGCPTTVGGNDSNELFSLMGESIRIYRRWTKLYPPMPTKRRGTSALCTETTLVVAGGETEDAAVLSTVEVMHTESHQWSTAADLPQPMCWATATVCGDSIYMLGGLDKRHSYSKMACTCAVSALHLSCIPSSLHGSGKAPRQESHGS